MEQIIITSNLKQDDMKQHDTKQWNFVMIGKLQKPYRSTRGQQFQQRN